MCEISQNPHNFASIYYTKSSKVVQSQFGIILVIDGSKMNIHIVILLIYLSHMAFFKESPINIY